MEAVAGDDTLGPEVRLDTDYVFVIGEGVVVNLVQAVYILLPGQVALLAVCILDVVQVERIPGGDDRLVVVFD